MTPKDVCLVCLIFITLNWCSSGYGDCDDPFHIKKQTWSTSNSSRDIKNAYKIFPHIYDQNVLQFIEGNCAYSLKLELPDTCFQIHAPTTYGRDPGLLTIDIFEEKITEKWKHAMSDSSDKNNYDAFFDFSFALWVDSLDEYIIQWISNDNKNDLNYEYFGIEWSYNLDVDLKIDSIDYINNKFYSLLIHSPSSSIVYEFISYKKPSKLLYNAVPKWLKSNIERVTFKAMNDPYPWNRDDQAVIVPVRISRATTNIYEMYDWYVNVMESTVLDNSLDGIIDDLNGDNVLTKYAIFSPLETQIEIGIFERPSDYTFGDFMLSKYENLLLESHDSIITTPFCGIDRWMDNHFGFTTWTVSGYLDRILYKLKERGIKYRIYKETKEHTTNRAKMHLNELGLDQLYIFFIFEPSGQTIQLMGDFANTQFNQNVPNWNQQWCEVPCPYNTYQGHVDKSHIYIDYNDYDYSNELYYKHNIQYQYHPKSLLIGIILIIFCIIGCISYIGCKRKSTKTITDRNYNDDLIPLIQK